MFFTKEATTFDLTEMERQKSTLAARNFVAHPMQPSEMSTFLNKI